MREALEKRLKTGQKRNEGGRKGFFKEDLEDVKFWRCTDGQHLVDIIPYLAGPNDPAVEEGEETYTLELFVHQNVGVTDGMKICLAETYGKPCPICERRKQLQREGADEDTIKDLTPSRYPRSVYNVVCYDSREEEDKGVQIWHTSSYLLEQYLLELAKKPVRPGREEVEPFIIFADADEGKSVSFKRTGKAESTKFIGIAFDDRDYAISDDVLDEAYCLDELIHVPSYDELYEWYWGGAADENVEEEPKEKSTRVSRRTREEEEPKEETRTRRPRKEKEPKEEPKEESRTRRQPRKEKEEPRKEEETTRVSRRPRKEKEEPKKEEKETRTRRQPRKEKAEPLKCPAGGVFGKDIDELGKDCDSCDIWNQCAKEADRLDAEERKR